MSKKFFILVCNCHFDNRLSIIKDLGISPSTSQHLSDCQIALLAYDQWGDKCVDHLLGDYAFALKEKLTSKIFCVRDPIGIQPFYYVDNPNRFECSIAIKKLVEQSNIKLTYNEDHIASYLSNKFYSHHSFTFFNEIKKLPPGHILSISQNKISIKRYWHPETLSPIHLPSNKAYEDTLYELYANIIKDYATSADTGSIGIELSGGLDSSSITALTAQVLKQQGKKQPKTYTWLPDPSLCPHLPGRHIYGLIDDICQQEPLTPTHICPSTEDILEYFQRNPAHQPTTSTSVHQLPILKLAQKDGVSLMLSGLGGDDCVTHSGRGYHEDLIKQRQWLKLYRQIKSETRTPLIRAIKLLINYALNEIKNSLLNGHQLTKENKKFESQFSKKKPYKQLHNNPNRYKSSVKQDQINFLTGSALSERLEAEAEMGMEYGIRYRYPLLDRRLLEFCLAIPPEQFIEGKTRRKLARHTFAKFLPDSICFNTDKSDLLRCKAFDQKLANTTEALANRIKNKGESEYVNKQKLLNHLNSEEYKNHPKFGRIKNALLTLNITYEK